MFNVQQFDEVSSTNDVVKAAIRDGGPEGFAVLARKQTGGYGRQGRTWTSPVGGMYLSVLLRPDIAAERIPTLSLAVGIAVRRALASLLAEVAPSMAETIMLKWPNDVVFGNSVPFKKLCGISLECINGAVCVGIGVNVFPSKNVSRETFVLSGRNQPVYLAELCGLCGPKTPDEVRKAFAERKDTSAAKVFGTLNEAEEFLSIKRVCDAVLRELEIVYRKWTSGNFSSMHDEYEKYSVLRNQFVVIEANDGSPISEGEVLRTNEDGNLVLLTSSGKIVRASSGEAHVRVVK